MKKAPRRGPGSLAQALTDEAEDPDADDRDDDQTGHGGTVGAASGDGVADVRGHSSLRSSGDESQGSGGAAADIRSELVHNGTSNRRLMNGEQTGRLAVVTRGKKGRLDRRDKEPSGIGESPSATDEPREFGPIGNAQGVDRGRDGWAANLR